MAPSHSRQLLAWSLPTIAVLLSYLWYKRKRIGARSDPGGTIKTDVKPSVTVVECEEKIMREEVTETESKKFSRSLSGVESEPIDIIIPKELRSSKSLPLHISDEDLDKHIEKVKSMKNSTDIYTISKQAARHIETPKMSPLKPQFPSDNNEVKKKSGKNNKKQASKKNNNNNENKPMNEKKEVVEKMEIPKSSPIKNAEKIEATHEIKPSTSLNINSKEFTPKSYEEPKQIETEFRPIKAEEEEEKQENMPTAEQNLQREGIEISSDERDSANHSPVDAMLASPSLSNISDNHSEGSNDSGKGCSEVATSPSRTPAVTDIPDAALPPTVYDFIIPQLLVGKLIGRAGSTIKEIKNKSKTHILVKQHPENRKVKLCVIEGTPKCIDKALKLIRDKFPAKKYPDVTMEQCFLAIPAIQLNPDALYLRLVEGIDNDTVVSCLVKPNYLFLQQHTHPTYMSLNTITESMNMDYSSPDSPTLHCPVPENSVCAGFSVNQWCRVLILSNMVEQNKAYVTFLDYGGYAFMDYSDLRQIRAEYLRIPFQAQGVILAGIRAVGGGDEWAPEAYELMRDLTLGKSLLTQIEGFTEWGDPLVHIYAIYPNKMYVYLNKELVDRGFAEWADQQYSHPLWLCCQEDSSQQDGEYNEMCQVENAFQEHIYEVQSNQTNSVGEIASEVAA